MRSGAGERHRRFAPGEIVQPRIVEELRTVVAVKACAGEGGLPFPVGDLFLAARRAFVPDGPQLGPTAENVRQDEAPDKIAGQRAAAVRHRVGFDETRTRDVPVAGADGEVMFEQRARLGAGQTFARIAHPQRLEPPIQRGRTQGQQLCPAGDGERGQMRQPLGQRGAQSFGTHLIAGQPDPLEHRQ